MPEAWDQRAYIASKSWEHMLKVICITYVHYWCMDERSAAQAQYMPCWAPFKDALIKFWLWVYNAVKMEIYRIMSEKCEIVSSSLVRKTAKPGIVSNYYHSFCLGIAEWYTKCIKMEESRKSLSLTSYLIIITWLNGYLRCFNIYSM